MLYAPLPVLTTITVPTKPDWTRLPAPAIQIELGFDRNSLFCESTRHHTAPRRAAVSRR